MVILDKMVITAMFGHNGDEFFKTNFRSIAVTRMYLEPFFSMYELTALMNFHSLYTNIVLTLQHLLEYFASFVITLCVVFKIMNRFQGHFPPYFGPGGLRAPCVLACAMRSLAIVITIVQSFLFSLFLSFFSPFFAFDPLRGISHVRNNFSPNILA